MRLISVLMILFVTLNTISSQLILKKAVNNTLQKVSSGETFQFIFTIAQTPWLWLALSLQGIGYLVWIFVITKAKLGPAFAVSGSFFYILLALASWFFYDERLTLTQWAGIVVVTIGVILLILPTGK
ncbi:MAG: hypothetical protein ACLFR2_09995 [Candidatus Kapaibacterium sp.]